MQSFFMLAAAVWLVIVRGAQALGQDSEKRAVECTYAGDAATTIYSTRTIIYSKGCSSAPYAVPTYGIQPTPYITTYTTSYGVLCSTGISTTKCTVTETYNSQPLDTTRPSNYIPQGFTTTVATCTTCGPSHIIATITTPAAATASTTGPSFSSYSGNGAITTQAAASHGPAVTTTASPAPKTEIYSGDALPVHELSAASLAALIFANFIALQF